MVTVSAQLSLPLSWFLSTVVYSFPFFLPIPQINQRLMNRVCEVCWSVLKRNNNESQSISARRLSVWYEDTILLRTHLRSWSLIIILGKYGRNGSIINDVFTYYMLLGCVDTLKIFIHVRTRNSSLSSLTMIHYPIEGKVSSPHSNGNSRLVDHSFIRCWTIVDYSSHSIFCASNF